jgi:pimeloyl-ACP methyl ester carboxylesterase
MQVDAGIHLNYELEGSGTPLVLTHGLGDDLHFWDNVAAELAQHHALLRWDVRGFGLSDKPPGPYSPALFASDLNALLDVLGLAQVHLGGLSMGGVIALALPHRALADLVSTSARSPSAAALTGSASPTASSARLRQRRAMPRAHPGSPWRIPLSSPPPAADGAPSAGLRRGGARRATTAGPPTWRACARRCDPAGPPISSPRQRIGEDAPRPARLAC